MLAGGITTWLLLSRRRWPIKVAIINKNIKSHGSHIAGWDRARLVDILDAGEQIYYWKRRKKYRIGNEEYLGTKLMGWARGKDGYYRNVGLGDVDLYLAKAGLIPTNIEMRTTTGVVRKSLNDRHQTKTFLEKWGVPITILLLILAIGVQAGGAIWERREANKGRAAEQQTAEIQKETMQLAKETLSAISNIRLGGSGLIPA